MRAIYMNKILWEGYSKYDNAIVGVFNKPELSLEACKRYLLDYFTEEELNKELEKCKDKLEKGEDYIIKNNKIDYGISILALNKDYSEFYN